MKYLYLLLLLKIIFDDENIINVSQLNDHVITQKFSLNQFHDIIQIIELQTENQNDERSVDGIQSNMDTILFFKYI